MTYRAGSETGEVHAEFGRIEFSGFDEGDAEAPAFARRLQVAIEAKHFVLIFRKDDRSFVLRRCVARPLVASGYTAFTLLGEFSMERQSPKSEAAGVETVVSALREWTELAVATLLENASASSEDVTLPKRMNLEFDAYDLVASRI